MSDAPSPVPALWLDDLEQTEIEKIINLALAEFEAGGQNLVDFLHDRRVACIARIDGLGEAAALAEIGRQRDLDDLYELKLGRGATYEEIIHNLFKVGELVAVTPNGLGHRLNPAFVDHRLLETVIAYEELRIPSYSEAVGCIKTAMEIIELEHIRLLPAPAPPDPQKSPLARSAPQSAPTQPQAPDSISDGVRAQHPGYAPDPARTLANHAPRRVEPKAKQPPKYGGDDWWSNADA